MYQKLSNQDYFLKSLLNFVTTALFYILVFFLAPRHVDLASHPGSWEAAPCFESSGPSGEVPRLESLSGEQLAFPVSVQIIGACLRNIISIVNTKWKRNIRRKRGNYVKYHIYTQQTSLIRS